MRISSTLVIDEEWAGSLVSDMVPARASSVFKSGVAPRRSAQISVADLSTPDSGLGNRAHFMGTRKVLAAMGRPTSTHAVTPLFG